MTNNKPIAIICNYELLEDRVGGMDYFYWAFNKKCRDKGIKVDWFFPNLATHGDYGQFNIIHPLNTDLERHFMEYVKTQNVQYAFIITHFVELCTSFFFEIRKFQTSKVIVVDHNPRPLYGYPLIKRIKKRLKGLLYSKYIDVFVAVSDPTKHDLMHDFGNHIKNKLIVIYNGLDAGKYIKKTNFNSHNTFMVACHLRREKGVQDLIKAAKYLKHQNFTIDIYGKGYYEDTLKGMVRDFQLQDKIHFKGSVSNLHEIYHQYDYLIHPSHGETFGYAIVESLLSHLPVITTQEQGNVLGLVEDNRNGYLFEVGDVKALSELIKTIVKGERKASIAMEKFNATPFLIETMVNNYMTLIEE